ncbi:Aste57867_14024 [Aphanomyces stellatus]|uniref:Aste57867_14024 protein n=1 Tax=Aphanomyces stellatus TaxID=120398 RepID=A0A485L1A2_9STRA|nr:hypothetical protein As57867_013973 [Aphanomyces stellatus]VFT90854.1 Aste57867_14024 [Aphanomyces stellatus]
MRELSLHRMDDSASRDVWLRQQAEKLQNSVVNVHQGLSASPLLYFGTRRCTYSDVVSIVTTTQVQRTKETTSSVDKKLRAKMASVMPTPATAVHDNFLDPLFVSPLQNYQERQHDHHQRHKQALASEKAAFMNHLHDHRFARYRVEYRAASVVQRIYRGFALRKNFARVKTTLLIRNKVRAAMKDVTTGTGLILEEKDRTRARLRERTAAAVVLQRRFRRFLARVVVDKERQMVHEERLHRGARAVQSLVRRRLATCFVRKVRRRHYDMLCLALATTAQRMYRGHVGRTAGRSRRLAVQHAAVRLIQNAATRSLALKAMAVEGARVREVRCDGAAVAIQRCYRGAVGRRFVTRMRDVESHQIALAAVISIQRVFRGVLGRAISSNRLRWRHAEVAFMASVAITRVVRGFLGRRHAHHARIEQETNVFVHARRGDKEVVLDLLDGLGLDAAPDPNAVDGHGNTVLAVASKWGHLGIVRAVIGRIKLNVENDHGMTAIMLAVKHGHANVAEYLLTKAPTLATTGRTLLHEAARQGLVSTVEKLILFGMSVNYQDKEFKRTPLHEAVLGGHAATIQLLIDNCPKAALNYQDGRGATALHDAAKRGDRATVKALLHAECDVSVLNKHNETAWRVAMASGYEMIASDIRKKWGLMDQNEDVGAPPPADERDLGSTVAFATVDDPINNLDHLLEAGDLDMDEKDDDGMTMLMKGAARGFYTVVRFCLRHGARIDEVDKIGKTALMHAVAHCDIALHLLDQGADLMHKDERGRTVIHDAAMHGYTFSEYIAVNQIHLDIKDNLGCTPLHDAVKAGSDIGAKKLINLGAHVSCVDLDHRSPIHYAVRGTSLPTTLRVLLQAEEPALYLRDSEGRTALFDAVVAGNIPCLDLLVAHGGNLTDRDKDELSLLHVAIQAKQNASLDYLLVHLPPPELLVVNGANETPLHMACRLGYLFGVERLLKEAGPTLEAKLNASGDSPIQTATRASMVAVLEMFHQLGYDLASSVDKDTGATLLHLVAEIDTDALDAAIVPLLLGAGVSITAFDKKGFQPLHVASARSKGAGAVRALLANGAPVNTASKLTNMTPYHCAAQMGIGDNVQILKENGAR